MNKHLFGKYQIKVLLIDDQRLVSEMVKKMLAGEEDIVFFSSQDPFQGFKTAREIEPTVILLDLVMPDVDGMTMVRYFRNHPRLRDIPLIVLSSMEDPVTKADAFAQGANDYLVKLPDKAELIARIRYHSKAYINLLERNDAYEALLQSQKKLANELAYAGEYIVSLLPPFLNSGPIQVTWNFVPSAQLGGDSFGYHWLDKDHFAIYLLDVCGHGVGSALLSVQALNALKSQALPDVDFRDPSQVLEKLNDSFPMENHRNLYFTLWYGVYEKSKRLLHHASGGHPAAFLIVPGDPEPREIISENTFIGGFSGLPFEKKTDELPPGSHLYVLSDGVYETETTQGKYDNYPELLQFLRASNHDAPDEISAWYKNMVSISKKPVLDDDFSMMKFLFP